MNLVDAGDRTDAEQDLAPIWRAVVRLGPALIVGVFYLTVVLHYAYTPGDTYVYLQYAKNFASGDKFAFNADSPSYGVTAPLWVLVIAAGTKAGLDPLIVAKTFDLLFASLSVVVVYPLSSTIIQDKIYALFVTLVFSFDAWILHWSGSGMEVSLAVLLVLLAVKYAYVGDYHIAGFVAGLLTLVRPEGIILFFVIQTENYIVSMILGRNKISFWAAPALYGIVVVPWLVYSFMNFGSIIPNAFIAAGRAEWTIGNVLGGIFESAIFIGSTMPLPVFLLAGGLPLVIKYAGIGTFVAKGLPTLWIAGLILGFPLLSVGMGSRLLVPALPLIVLYGFWCLKHVEGHFHWSRRTSFVILGVLSFVTIAQSEIVYRLKLVPLMDASTKSMENGIKPIALWLRSNSKMDASVLTQDAGLLGYVGERKIFDTEGLITPKLRTVFDDARYDDVVKLNLDKAMVNPDYVMDRSSTRSRLSSDSLRPILTTEINDSRPKSPRSLYYTLYQVVK